MNKTIVLTGGGTAGHVMVNINLSPYLKMNFNKIVYIGSKNGIEKNLITNQTNYEFKEISTVKLDRAKKLSNLLIPFKLLKSIYQAKKILKQIKPDIIFSKGGYVGLPVVIAGKKLKIPVVVHESDMSLGLANKLAKHYANVICTAFKKTADENKCIHTGIPLKISSLTKSEATQKLNIHTNKKILLILGGSMGAKSINDFIFKNINALTKKYYVIHIVGKNNINKNIKNSNYKQIEFSNDLWSIYKATDIAISRAGANTIYELFANQIPTIFIPLPKNVSRGDQIENSLYFKNKHLCRVIFQENLNIKNLQNELEYIENEYNNLKNNLKLANFGDGTQNLIKILNQEKNTHN
ncbi:MAG: undecaprenyldiphospho-muramoylpentapeptide beta-N-acetylglucosaminyltransferase [Clostridia bacterium]|nr:undecaprenyldiphospho-muramoylpentapeptide beta-N-acetylglucosaminyltransferase [Clostridia bacterium]